VWVCESGMQWVNVAKTHPFSCWRKRTTIGKGYLEGRARGWKTPSESKADFMHMCALALRKNGGIVRHYYKDFPYVIHYNITMDKACLQGGIFKFWHCVDTKTAWIEGTFRNLPLPKSYFSVCAWRGLGVSLHVPILSVEKGSDKFLN